MPANQSEPVRGQSDYPEDEMELIDLLRIIWKWKYLITGGTVVFALAAIVISLMLPKIYRIETIVRPGILSISEDGKIIYIDTAKNIKTLIEAGTFDSKVLSSLIKSDGANNPNSLKVEVTLPKGSNAPKITYETSQLEQGIEILDLLVKLLIEEYSNVVEHFQNGIDRELNLAKAEIEKINSIKHSREINVSNIGKRIYELQTGIISVNENTNYLKKERNKLLLKEKNEGNILSAILYSNTIQQNLQLANDYENEIKDLKLKKEEEFQNISELKNEIQKQLTNIDGLESKKKNIQNIRIIRKPYSSPYPIKPKKKLIVILATFSGIFMMVFLSFCIEYITKNRKKRSLQQ